jgi:predicted unusual protein kinase regulating ubiquinone biosynthesis (AarF/ABC1/UbiB family)
MPLYYIQEENSWIEKSAIKGIRSMRAMRTVFDILLDYKMNFTEAQKSAVHGRSAEKLLRLCKENGGVYVKMGQHLSAMVHILYF